MRQVSATLAASKASEEPDIPTMQTAWPSHLETLPVTVPYLDPELRHDDDLLSIISPHSQLSEYVQTENEKFDERSKLIGKPVNVVAKQGTVDKLLLLHALQEDPQGSDKVSKWG